MKVGYANNLGKRLSEIQVGRPDDVDVFSTIWVHGEWAARKLEAAAHNVLAEYAIRGEWFDVPAAVAELAIRSAAQEKKIKLYQKRSEAASQQGSKTGAC